MRTVRDAGRMEGQRLRPDAASAREVAANVVDELVAVDGRVGVRAGDRLGMEVRHARDEGADEGAPRRERRVDRRGEVDETGLRLEREDREGERPDGPVPAHDVEGGRGRLAEDEAIPPLHEDALGPWARAAEVGAPEVPVRVGGVHPQLADRVAVLHGNVEPAAELERDAREPLPDPPAVDDAPRDEDVVALDDREVAEGSLERRRPGEDVEQVVAVAVCEAGRSRTPGREVEQRDDDVGVPTDGSPPFRSPLPEHETPPERLVVGPNGNRPVEGTRLGGPDRPVRHRRALVVEDRELAVEALTGEALLLVKGSGGGAEGGVGLARHRAELHSVDHVSRPPRAGSARCRARSAARPRSTRRGPGSSRSRTPCPLRAG